MTEFQVTVLYNGKLETFTVFHRSVSSAKKYITNHWNNEQLFGAKIIKVEKVKE